MNIGENNIGSFGYMGYCLNGRYVLHSCNE